MALETYKLDKKMLEYSISQFRNIPEYVKICEAFAVGCESIQNAVYYLSDMIDLSKAEGVWLDYLGWLVGEIRQEYINTTDFFCVNTTHSETLYKWTNNGENVYTVSATPEVGDGVCSYENGEIIDIGTVSLYDNNVISVTLVNSSTTINYNSNGSTSTLMGDINKSKRFYFPKLNNNSNYTSNLSDNLFNKAIEAKIAYNVSKGTREDYIRIIKLLVNADKVIIENYAPMLLKITLYGGNILTNNIKSRIENILQDGIGIYGDIIIYGEMYYETIESEINTIVEMEGIEGDYEDYGYIDIDEDLDYILEIE